MTFRLQYVNNNYKLTLLYLSILSPLIPLLSGIKKRLSLLWLYPLVGLIFDLLVFYFKRVAHVNHSIAGNLFILTEFWLISLLYRQKIFASKVAFIILTTTLSSGFIGTLFIRTISDFNIIGTSIFSLTYITYGIFGFYNLLKNQEEVYLERSSFFWLNTGLTIYASGNLLLFLFMDYLFKINRELFLSAWFSIFQILNITKNILIAVALYHYKPAPRESH